MLPQLPQLCTVPETAELFRVTPWTIRRWVHDPDHPLRAVQVGNRLLLVREEIQQLLAEQRVGAR